MSETAVDQKIKQRLERFKLSVDAYGKQVKREKAALAFQVPESQWPDAVKAQRQAQTINGIVLPERPMLSIPTLDQPIQLALNQERQAQLGVQIHPLTEDADDDTAEMLQGLYRHIERDSRANLARSWGHERAVKAGRGAYRINKALDRDSPEPTDQKIVIQRILRQEAVYPDPFAEQPDWSDGRYVFITSWLPWDRFKKKYPDAKIAAMDEGELTSLAEQAPEWIRDEGEARAVLIAEYWCVEEDDETGTRKVLWSTIDAIEELEPEQEWDGQYIPIVFTIGRELIPFDAERRWVGIIEPNMDGARLVNYAASGLVESAALEPKAPFDLDPEEIEGLDEYWKQANVRNWPYLPRHKFKGTREFGPVQRIQADASKMQLNAVLLEHGREFVRIGTGAFEPTTGEDSSRAKTGRAILALQQQHDQGNSNWLDNLAEISMTYEAKVVLDLIPHVYDRAGRVARILDQEDNPKAVMLNAPFVMQGKRPMAVDQGQPLPPNAEVKQYDLAKGRYGVSVTIGKAYKSRVEQGADELGQLFQAEPQLFSILGDIYLKFRDFPGHTEAAERVKKMLPPQLQGEDQQQANAAQLQAKLQAAMQQIQLLSKELDTRVKQIETEETKARMQVEIEQIKADLEAKLKSVEIAIVEKENATKIRIAEINAATKGYETEAQHAAQHEAQALDISAAAVQADLERENASHEAERQRQHESEQAERQRQHDLTAGAQQIEGQIAVTKAKPQPKGNGQAK